MMLLKLDRPPIARTLFSTALYLWACACLAQPAESAGGDIRVSGFGTLGIAHADAPAGWGYRRDIGQPTNSGGTRADIDSRLGLQLNYAPTPQFELVGQVLATRRSSYAGESDAIEWAFAAYRPSADVMLRVGRLNLDQFLMSDYRSVGFAYVFARPPVEFYGSLPTSLDGTDIARVWNLAGTRWRAKAFAGNAHSGDLSNNGRTEVRPVFGAMVSREADGLLLRAGLTRAGLATSPAALQPLLDGLSSLSALPVADVSAQAAALRSRLDFSRTHVTFAAFGISYERQDWQWTAELTRVSGHPSASFVAGYAGIGRRFGPVTVFGVASGISTHEPTVDTPAWGAALAPVLGPAIAQQAQLLGTSAAFAANLSGASQRTLSLGARWDIHPQFDLKFQWDRVRISANGGRLWANATLDAGHANVGSVVLDFVF